ncbi:MAG: hypothetical protein ACRD0D_08305 [Acidimicrobiales bacterium]
MHELGILVLLGLALVKIVDLAQDLAPQASRFRTPLTLVLAVAGALALDYSIFRGWGVELRSAELGPWVTGFMIAGTTTLWRAAFGWLGQSEPGRPDTKAVSRPRAA